MSETPRVKIFISYAHNDRKWCNLLIKHLSGLDHEIEAEVWADDKIMAGAQWDLAIKAQLDAAQIIVLIITHEFLCSNYCKTVELWHATERAREGNVRVYPIIADYCDWQSLKIKKYQCRPMNKKQKLKELIKWGNKNEPMAKIAEEIRSFCHISMRDQNILENSGENCKINEYKNGNDIFEIHSTLLNKMNDICELSVGVTQDGSHLFPLNVELRAGGEYTIRGPRSRIVMTTNRIIVQLACDGCNIPSGRQYGDPTEDNPIIKSLDERCRIDRIKRQTWSIENIDELECVKGYLLGNENLCDIKLLDNESASISLNIISHKENLNFKTFDSNDLLIKNKNKNSIIKKLLKKNLQKERHFIVFSESELKVKKKNG